MLMMFVAAGAAVVAVSVLVSGLAGAVLGLVLLIVGGWRAWGLLQTWRSEGSEASPRGR